MENKGLEQGQGELNEELVVQYIAGSASEEERKQVLGWINAKPENKVIFNELKECYHLTKIVQKPTGFDKKEGWLRIKANFYKSRFEEQQKSEKNRRIRMLYRLSAAVAAVLVIVFAWMYFDKSHNQDISKSNIAFTEIVVPYGSKSQLTLPDSTKVWINAGSKLSYASNFNKSNRKVKLEGEAFFDVQKSEEHLFIVETEGININVFGTRFNVKSYPDEAEIQTTLIEGSLAIHTHDNSEVNNMVYLEPNQTATYYKNTSVLKTNVNNKVQPTSNNAEVTKSVKVSREIDTAPITSWKDNKWIFEAEDLDKIAVILERRYNVNIIFENEDLKKYKLSGTLIEETFEQVLKVIQLSAPIEYEIENNNILFKEDRNYKKKYDKLITN